MSAQKWGRRSSSPLLTFSLILRCSSLCSRGWAPLPAHCISYKHPILINSSTRKTSFLCHTHPLTTGHAAFSTHREASRETCAAGGFHRASKVLFLPVFLSLWSTHPPRWVVFRGSGEFHKGCPIHVPILLLDPPLCLDHPPKLKINITGYLSETDI